MKSTGMVRKIDELGRIVIPIEIRNTLSIESRDSLEIFTDGDKIVLCKYQPSCLFCGKGEETVFFHGKMICRTCLDQLKEQF